MVAILGLVEVSHLFYLTSFPVQLGRQADSLLAVQVARPEHQLFVRDLRKSDLQGTQGLPETFHGTGFWIFLWFTTFIKLGCLMREKDGGLRKCLEL